MLLLGQRPHEALAVLERAERALDCEAFPTPACSTANARLSERERHVLALVSRGLSNKRIAVALTIAPETVKMHIKRIFSKLEVGTRAEAVFRAGNLGLSACACER
ncbi:MAG: helix-turn-helix transcriptional regulator [Steroidobacteraceae bacterium]